MLVQAHDFWLLIGVKTEIIKQDFSLNSGVSMDKNAMTPNSSIAKIQLTYDNLMMLNEVSIRVDNVMDALLVVGVYLIV